MCCPPLCDVLRKCFIVLDLSSESECDDNPNEDLLQADKDGRQSDLDNACTQIAPPSPKRRRYDEPDNAENSFNSVVENVS